jgi:hypothetical protein
VLFHFISYDSSFIMFGLSSHGPVTICRLHIPLSIIPSACFLCHVHSVILVRKSRFSRFIIRYTYSFIPHSFSIFITHTQSFALVDTFSHSSSKTITRVLKNLYFLLYQTSLILAAYLLSLSLPLRLLGQVSKSIVKRPQDQDRSLPLYTSILSDKRQA